MNKTEKVIRDYMVDNDGIYIDEQFSSPLVGALIWHLLKENMIIFDEKSKCYIWVAADSKQSKILREEFTVLR